MELGRCGPRPNHAIRENEREEDTLGPLLDLKRKGFDEEVRAKADSARLQIYRPETLHRFTYSA